MGFGTPWGNKGSFKVALDHADPDYRCSLGYCRNNGIQYTLKNYWGEDIWTELSYTSTNFNTHPEQGLEKSWITRVNSQGYVSMGEDFKADDFVWNVSVSLNQVSLKERFVNLHTVGVSSLDNKRHIGSS